MSKVTFRGGVHPLHAQHEGKTASRDKAIREFTAQTVCIPMDMHLCPPSEPCVKKGDHVLMGQVIATANGPRGLAVHASVSGEVVSVARKQGVGRLPAMAITIQNDGQDEWTELHPLGNVEEVDAEKIIPAIRDAGISGMGGASFPTFFKMTPPKDKPIDTIILNGAECETFLTADYRLMLEMPGRVVDGLRAAMRAMDVKRGLIAIEDNKPEAIEAVRKAAAGREGVDVVVLKTKYPQGGEKQLIEAVTGRQVPSGGLPCDAKVLVLNVATAAAIADAVIEGKPLVERVTTVTGCVKEPANLLLRIGTSVADAVENCGGYTETPGKILFGGTMTGLCIPDETVTVCKANNGIVVLNEKQARAHEEDPCIRCGKCADACPTRLKPYELRRLIGESRLEDAVKEHLHDCTLCGCCSYICPSKRWLSASIKEAKDILAARRNSK